MATFLLNNNLTQIAVKRLSGKAMTNSTLSVPQEAFGSSVQTLASTVFAEVIPNEPNNASNQIYLIQSESNSHPGTVMLVDFDVVPIGSSQYINDTDVEQSTEQFSFASGVQTGQNTVDTYHAYILKLTGSFESDLATIGATYFGDNASTGTALGSAPFASGFTTSGSLKLQIVPEYASTLTSGNPYVPKISQLQDPEDFVNPISATSPEDMYLDPFAGILFVQDPVDYDTGTGNVPGKVRAFIYVGKYQDEVTFSANDVNFIVSGSDEGFAVGNDDTINFVSGSAGVTVESNSSTGTITIGESTDNVTFNQITASIINVDTVEASEYIVSSSITYMTQSFSSGSTIFGDTDNDTHQFTGSIQILHTGSGYGFQMSGSNFSIDWGDSGSVTMGEYNVGTEYLGVFGPLTGSGLIISQSFTNENTHHNMVKIGETELVDISGSLFDSDAFLINVREKALVISSSNLNSPLAKIAPGDTIFYAQTTDQAAIKILGDNLTLGANTDSTTINASTLSVLAADTLNIGVGAGEEDDYFYNVNKSLLIGQTNNIDNGTTGTPIKAAFLNNIYPLFYGAVTASAVSSSGLLYASSSDAGVNGSIYQVALLDTASGLFYTTASSAIQGDTTDIEADITELQASASAGIQFRTGSHTVGTSIALMGTASFVASGDGLSVDEDSGTITYTIGGGILSGSAQIATDISGAIGAATGSLLTDYGLLSGSAQIATDISGAIGAATASLSASIVGTANEVTVVGTVGGNITIGLPDEVTIVSASIGDLVVTGETTQLQVTNLNVDDQFILLNSHSAGTAAPLDGGIIVQTSGSAAAGALGTALFYDNATNRWALASSSSIAWNTTDATPDQYVVSVEINTTTPPEAPNDFGLADGNREGMMYIDTNDTDGDGNNIWIYA